ncbi:MAG: DinB family protein [Candidatus Dormiibacterota bacterium]
MPAKPLPVEKVPAVLAATPQRIQGFTRGLTSAHLRMGPSPGEWSANEVLAHLRSGSEDWANRTTEIVSEHEPVLPAISPRNQIESTDFRELEFAPSLRSLAAQRADLLTVPEALPTDW